MRTASFLRRALLLLAPLVFFTLTALAQAVKPAGVPKQVEVTGQLKITGGNPGEGKVLTSDAEGLGTWEAPVTATRVYTGTLPKVASSTTYISLPADLQTATIVGVTAAVALEGNYLPPGYSAFADRSYYVAVEDRRIRLDTNNSSRAILGQPVKVLLTYLP